MQVGKTFSRRHFPPYFRLDAKMHAAIHGTAAQRKPSPNLAQAPRLLENLAINAGPQQRQRRSQPANAAADHDAANAGHAENLLEQERSSFLKKRTKKLLSLVAMLLAAHGHCTFEGIKVFWSFFSKKDCLPGMWTTAAGRFPNTLTRAV